MLQVADSFAKVTNPTDRAKMAVNMFGRAGDEMIPVLAHLRQKMDALRDSEQVGATERAQVKATDQAFSEMTRALGGLGRAVAKNGEKLIAGPVSMGLNLAAGGESGAAKGGLMATLFQSWGMAADLLHGENPWTAEKMGKRHNRTGPSSTPKR